MIIFTQNQPITFEHIDAVKEMADKIKRVRELHAKSTYGNHCPFCTEQIRDVDLDHWWHGYVDYPCPTIKALDGEQ